MSTTTTKRCACCGENAGRWEQWHNQDTRYGICRSCADWVMTRTAFGRPDPKGEPLEFCRTYGLPGIHYEPKKYRHHGLDFAIVAEYQDTEEGTAKANAFMGAFPNTGLLAVDKGRIIIAALADKGAEA